MDKIVTIPDPQYPVDVHLKNPPIAALLAWLIPGAGHLYQRRYAKGIMFMVTILGTYFFGLAIGGGKVVYASFRQPDMRYPFLCQVAVGIPTFPALVQWHRVMHSKPPQPPLWNGFMAPPRQPVQEQFNDELGQWHRSLKSNFELGTLYTMIAGLLNILVIYDAYAGPMFMVVEPPEDKPPPDPPQSGGA